MHCDSISPLGHPCRLEHGHTGLHYWKSSGEYSEDGWHRETWAEGVTIGLATFVSFPINYEEPKEETDDRT